MSNDEAVSSMDFEALSEKAAEPAQPPQEDRFVKCPCCGQHTLKKPVKLGDDLLTQWLACTATGLPFSHVYKLYGGRVLITATQPGAETIARLAAASAAIDYALNDKDYTGLQAAELQNMMNSVRLFSCVNKVAFTSPTTRAYDTGAAAEQAVALLVDARADQRVHADRQLWHDKLVKANTIITDNENVSAIPLGVLLAVGQTHVQLTDILMDAGFDADFWQGIELA